MAKKVSVPPSVSRRLQDPTASPTPRRRPLPGRRPRRPPVGPPSASPAQGTGWSKQPLSYDDTVILYIYNLDVFLDTICIILMFFLLLFHGKLSRLAVGCFFKIGLVTNLGKKQLKRTQQVPTQHQHQNWSTPKQQQLMGNGMCFNVLLSPLSSKKNILLPALACRWSSSSIASWGGVGQNIARRKRETLKTQVQLNIFLF